MKNLLLVAAFAFVTIGFFTWFSNFGIPQIRPAPPPKEEVLEFGEMTMEQFVQLGERVFNGKGTCKLCHNPVGGRAPLLDRVGEATAERLADDGYQGEATDVESYLYESMVKPSAYVVAGFGKAGTDDTVSPMPDVSTGSVGLGEAEMRAVVAYLQDASGLEVTVEIPEAAEGAVEAEAEAEPRAPLGTVEEAIAEFSCGACHKVAGDEGDVGPDLTRIGGKYGRDYLRRAILDPNLEIAEGFEADAMPADYGEQMYAAELEMLVDYLAGLK